MSRSRLGIISAMLSCALLWVIALPARAISWVLDSFPFLADPRPLADLFGRPTLALAGPSDHSIDSALANDQRHEAGLARLGAVRHR